MKLSHLLTAPLAGAVVFLISGAESSPRFQAPMFSPLPLQAGSKCGLVNSQLVCGNTSGGKHHHDDDDDQQGNDDHHKKKKNNDDDSGLTECTIQQSNGGGGCVAPLKYVCEKLKNGKKCCGCVGDKNAKAKTNATPATPTRICCNATAIDKDNGNKTVNPAGCGASQAEAEQALRNAAAINNFVIQGALSCAPG